MSFFHRDPIVVDYPRLSFHKVVEIPAKIDAMGTIIEAAHSRPRLTWPHYVDGFPFGEEVRRGSSTASDARGAVAVGRLYPLPVYVVRVTSASVSRTRVVVGAERAATLANALWAVLALAAFAGSLTGAEGAGP
jgi:hypothetical protein